MRKPVEYREPEMRMHEGDPESPISLERLLLAELFGATPLIRTDNQEQVYEDLLRRIIDNRPVGLSDELYDYILHHFEIRFSKRQLRNSDSYSRRLNKNETIFSDEQRVLIGHAQDGLAYPDELLDVRELLGMPDIEIGRVTHPYGKQLRNLDELRFRTRQAIKDKGGHLFSFHEKETFEVEDALRSVKNDAESSVDGLLIVRTRLIGTLPDLTEVYERSSFILDVNKALTQDQLLALWENLVEDKRSLDAQVSSAIDVEEIVRPLLVKNKYTLAIPVSSTVYAVNHPTKDMIQESIKQVRREQLAQERPPADWFLEAMRNSRPIGPVDDED